MEVSAVIWRDSPLLGEWIDVDLPEETSSTQLQYLVALCGRTWPMRWSGSVLQVLSPGPQYSLEIVGQIHQLLADIVLRERIAHRCVVQMDVLVEGVLCHLMKS